jgi:rhamnosyltransferase
MKNLGVVVAYFPNLKELTFNISSYINGLNALIIWDNTPDQENDFFQSIIQVYGEKIQVMSTGKNEGIGYALNKAAQWGINNHYDYLLTMDQDSHFADDNFVYYLKMIEKAKYSDVAVYTPLVCTQSEKPSAFEGDFLELKACLTSGSIMPLTVFDKIGFFNEAFFIDAIDHEICSRARSHAFKILRVNNVYLNHILGEEQEYHLLGKKLYSYNYPPMRIYYSLRNYIYIYKKYKEKELIQYILYNQMLKRGIAILLLQPDKRKKLYAMFLGIRHGLKGKSGIYQL